MCIHCAHHIHMCTYIYLYPYLASRGDLARLFPRITTPRPLAVKSYKKETR